MQCAPKRLWIEHSLPQNEAKRESSTAELHDLEIPLVSDVIHLRSRANNGVDFAHAVPTKSLLSGLASGLPSLIHVQVTEMIRRFNPSATISPKTLHSGSRRRQMMFWGAIFAVAMLTLSACADDSGDRRFANETPPTVDPNSITPTVAPTMPPETTAAGPILLSPEALIVSRGAASNFYVHSGPSVVVFSADGSKQKTVWKGKVGEFRDVSTWANGDRAAILTKLKAGYNIVIVDNAGKKIQEIENVGRSLDSATPTPSSGAGRDQVDWAPQGNQLLVAFENGGIVRVPLNGKSEVVLDASRAPGPIDAEWSPAGNAIAFVDRDDLSSPSHLYVVS